MAHVPTPIQGNGHEASDDWSDKRPPHRGEHNESDRVLLLVRLPHVGDHAKGYRPARRRQTAEKARDDNRAEVLGEGSRELENWKLER
jgi:hypothetical protein